MRRVQVGTIQSKLGDFDGALVSFQLSSEVFSKLFGAHNKKTLDVWRKVPSLSLFECQSSWRTTQYIQHIQHIQHHTVHTASHGTCLFQVAIVSNNSLLLLQICLLLVKLKRFEEAETQLNQVLKAEKAVFGGSSTNIIETHKLLAMVYKVNGKRSDMIKQYETIQQIYVQNFGTKDKRTKQIAAQVCSSTWLHK